MNIMNLFFTGVASIALTAQIANAQNFPPEGYGSTYQRGYQDPYAYTYRPNNYNTYNPGYNSYGYYSDTYRNSYPQPRYNYPQGYGQNYSYPSNSRPAYGYNNPQAYYPPYYGYKNNKSGFNKMFDDNDMPFFGNSNFAEELWPGRDSVWEDAAPIDGPWNRNWGRAPWNRDYDDLWEPEGGPDKWFDMDDPKEGAAWMWEDFLVTPNRLGTMPGGWEAPSIVVPNPVDVGDELKDAAIDMPGEMQDFSEGFTYGDEGYNKNPDAGTFGMGKKKKKDGINIQPKTYR